MNGKYRNSSEGTLPRLTSSSWCGPVQSLAKKLKYFRNSLSSNYEYTTAKSLKMYKDCFDYTEGPNYQNRRYSTGSTKPKKSLITLGHLTPPRPLLKLPNRPISTSLDQYSWSNQNSSSEVKETLQKIYSAPVAFEGIWLANTIPPGQSAINKDLTGLSVNKVLRCLNLVSLTPYRYGSFNESQLLLYDITANKDKALITRPMGKYFQRVQRSNLIRELKIWSQLSHDSCLRLFGVFQIDMNVHLIVEVASLHTLEHYINSRLHLSVKESDAQKLIWSAARGLNYLHRQGIVHRDLRPGTLVIGSDLRLKIAGFSKALKLTVGYSLCLCGKPQFRPPEMFTDKEFDLFKVDVWALGVVGYYILMQMLPFPVSYSEASARLWPVDNRLWPHSQQSYSFLSYLLEPNPKLRPTALQILYHKWTHWHTNPKS